MADSPYSKVYLLLIVTNIPYFIEGQSEIIGVFSSREKAEEVAQVRTLELQDDPWYRRGEIAPLIYELEIDSEYSGFDTVGDFPYRAAEKEDE